jgi:glutaredoxin|tara:strand:- start:54 stop:428 length:375 start_codon:yes stop_codon:yes gene_type:complete
MEKITIYTNETCPYCKQIKASFKENNIDFIEKLTSNFREEWEKINDLTGMGTLPTILFKDNYFIPGRDFNSPQQLIEYINNFKQTDYDSNRKILERLKTLNYNIHIAFRGVDTILRNIENKLNK